MTESTNHAGDEGRTGRVLGGRYELLARIGTGASAITWRARDQRLDRLVAVKVLRPEYAEDADIAQRFDREARTAAALSHPNVVEIFDVGIDAGTHYLVMQLVDGEDLKHLIVREGPLQADRARDILIQMLSGLQAIHRAGIVHRDIKPQNVLVDRAGMVRVTDFGIAQDAGSVRLTTKGMTLGTAAYMSPEQANGEDVSEASDIYAAGVVLYELLTGRLPFMDTNPVALLRAHIDRMPLAPSVVAPDAGIPAAFDAIAMQALAKHPQDRFRSAQAMARALQGASLTGGGAPQATPTTQMTRPLAAPARPVATSAAPRQMRTQPPPRQQGSQVGLWVLLILIVAMLGAIGVYAWETYLNDDPATPISTPRPTQTAEDVPVYQPPVNDDEQQVIEPSDGGYEEVIEDPTFTPEPTLEPTEPPVATETVPIIEPGTGGDVATIAPENDGQSPETNDDGGIIEPGG